MKIGQVAADFLENFRKNLDNPEAPEITIRNFDYLYLSNDRFSTGLRMIEESPSYRFLFSDSIGYGAWPVEGAI